MDEFVTGCVTAMVVIGIIAGGILLGVKIDTDAQLRFAEICTHAGKGVEYRDVGGNLVSECK